MVYRFSVLGNRYNAIKLHLMAIRNHHLRAGSSDLLAGKEQMWMCLRGMKRASAETVRKYPVTGEMMDWLFDNLAAYREDGSFDESKEPMTGSRENDTIMWGVLNLGFYWLLRASEYLECSRREIVWFESQPSTNTVTIPAANPTC